MNVCRHLGGAEVNCKPGCKEVSKTGGVWGKCWERKEQNDDTVTEVGSPRQRGRRPSPHGQRILTNLSNSGRRTYIECVC